MGLAGRCREAISGDFDGSSGQQIRPDRRRGVSGRPHKYTLYVMDYGAPVGYRLALRHPERVQALIVQNGNAYDEGAAGVLWSD